MDYVQRPIYRSQFPGIIGMRLRPYPSRVFFVRLYHLGHSVGEVPNIPLRSSPVPCRNLR